MDEEKIKEEKKIISIEGYKKIYNKTTKELTKKDFFNELKIIILVFGIFIIVFVLLSILVKPILIIGVLVFSALMLFFIIASYIKNNYNFEIKKEFTNIEKLKKEYRKLTKQRAKKNLFIISGIYIFIFLFMLLSFHFLHITIDNNISTTSIILSIIGVLMGYIALIFSEINFYKNKISEKEFEKIEEKVNNEYNV